MRSPLDGLPVPASAAVAAAVREPAAEGYVNGQAFLHALSAATAASAAAAGSSAAAALDSVTASRPPAVAGVAGVLTGSGEAAAAMVSSSSSSSFSFSSFPLLAHAPPLGMVLLVLLLALMVWQRGFLRYVAEFFYVKLRLLAFVRAGRGITDVFHERLARDERGACLVYERVPYSFRDVDLFSNAVGNWLCNTLKLPPDSCVALLMDSRPEFLGFWLGAAKGGLRAALLNATMKGAPLAHAIGEASPRALVVGHEVAGLVAAIADQLPQGLLVFTLPDLRMKATATSSATSSSFSSSSPSSSSSSASSSPSGGTGSQGIPGAVDVGFLLHGGDRSPVPHLRRLHVRPHDPVFLIYTSGTTGLPKAAKVAHSRFYMAGLSFTVFFRVTAGDVIYCPLPLYHSSAGLLGVGMSWVTGARLVVRRKFSASAFFKDCVEARTRATTPIPLSFL